MAGEIEIGGGSEPSPWANDQPVPPAPIEFQWSSSGEPTVPAEAPPADAQRAAPRPAGDAPHDIGPPPTGQRRRLAAIGAVAVLAVIVGALVLSRNDPGADDGASGGPATDATTTTEVVQDEPLPELEPATTEARPSTTSRPTGDGAGSGEPSIDAAAWSEETLELPQRLRRFTEPTTLVVTTTDGVYREIDMPSGRIQSLQLPPTAVNGQLVVGATTSLLATYSGSRGTSRLVAVGQAPIELELESERNEMVAIPNTDEYAGYYFGGSSDSQFREVWVFADGSTEVRVIDGAPPWQRAYSPNGQLLVTDAGGVYSIDGDGVGTRVTTGVLLATSARHLLVRECSEQYVCGYELIDVATNERRAAAIDPDDDLFYMLPDLQLAPDGRFLRYVEYSDTRIDDVFIDLETGERTVGTPFTPSGAANVWANDSSGVFRSNGTRGLQFVDRVTGEVTVFGEELGQVQSYSVRPAPAASSAASAGPVTTGLSIIGFGPDGGVFQIDIDTGAVIATPSPPLVSGSPAFVFTDAEGATIASFDNVPSIRFDAATATARQTTEMGPTGPMIAGPLPGTVWQPRQLVRASDPLVVDLVDSLGVELGQQIEIGPSAETELLGSDGVGGVLVRAELGGVYSLGPDGAVQLLTSGAAIAVGATTAYVRECDEAFTCGVFRLDRISGERVLVDVPAFELAGGDDAAGGPFGQSVSPDGNVALVRVSGFGTAWTMVDIANAVAVPVPGLAVGSPLLWSDDSQWALYLSGDVLRLYDRASGGLRTLANLPDLKTFGRAL